MQKETEKEYQKIQFTKIVSEKTNKYDIELTKETLENKRRCFYKC